jgi:hypothetical protein
MELMSPPPQLDPPQVRQVTPRLVGPQSEAALDVARHQQFFVGGVGQASHAAVAGVTFELSTADLQFTHSVCTQHIT